MAERRRNERYPAALRVALRRRGGVEYLQTLDISRHGAFLRTNEPRPTRELLQLVFELPRQQVVEGMCMVVRSLPVGSAFPPGPGMGVEFFSLSREAKTLWDAFVQHCRILASVAPPPAPVVIGTVLAPPAPPPPVVAPIPAAPARRVHVKVAACFLLRLEHPDALRDLYAKELSHAACFIRTPVLRAVGDDVDVILVHPETDEEFHLPGKVATVMDQGPPESHGLGIALNPLPPEEDVELVTFIETGVRQLPAVVDTSADRLTQLTRAVVLEPENWRAHFDLGTHLLDDLRDIPPAVRELLRTLELHPACADAHRKLHRAYIRLRDPVRAGEHLRVAIALENVQWDEVSESTGIRKA